MRWALLVLALVLSAGPARAAGDPQQRFDDALAGLGADPAAAVTALEALAAERPAPALAPDALFAAARATEERLFDPARALAMYERLVAAWPDARAAVGAGRRAADLRATIGDAPGAAAHAAAFARLRAVAGPLDDAQRAEARALADAAWPGAPEVAIWLIDLTERAGDLDGAVAQADALAARVVGTRWEIEVARVAAALAVARRDWPRARELLARLPGDTPTDQALLTELRDAIAAGRQRERWRLIAAAIAGLGLLGLLASLLHVARGRRALRRALRPPMEVWYLAPVALLLVIAGATGFVGIGTAVAWISGGGLVVAWLSGAGLDAARRAGQLGRGRILAHAALAPIIVLAVVALALLREDLARMVFDTLRAGPDR